LVDTPADTARSGLHKFARAEGHQSIAPGRGTTAPSPGVLDRLLMRKDWTSKASPQLSAGGCQCRRAGDGFGRRGLDAAREALQLVLAKSKSALTARNNLQPSRSLGRIAKTAANIRRLVIYGGS